MQQNRTGIVARHINTKIPLLDELNLPKGLQDITMMPRGLIIVTGATGSGKSSTLAAMVGYRNHHAQDHIITVEDPIEYVHTHAQSIVTQREVGMDTDSWESALKNTLRQAPDVIMIGEIRDRETMQYALAYAETGHLCLSTVHANNANQTLDRILSFFPKERREQLLMDLSLNLRAVISQRLIPLLGGKGRVPAVEIMLNSPLVSDLVLEGRLDELKDIMSRSRDLGMQTFDQALFDLYSAGTISAEDALRNADSFNDLRLRIKLHIKGVSGEAPLSGLEHLDLI
jgi:twitching motility protein PilU